MTITPVTCSLEEAKAQVGQEGACLSGEEREITVLVHPKYTRNQVAGVKKELDALSRRYSKELGGVVVAYEKLQLMSSSGWLFDTNPFIHLRVSARFIVFCPAAGDTLKAVVRKKSQHHLGCLAHGSFNISVPRPPRESVEGWAGTLAAEGDTLTLTVLFTSLTSYLMPFIRASIHPDCARELQERAETAAGAEEAATASTSADSDRANLPNTRTVFDDDSGISSNEADENGKTPKRKRSGEIEQEEEQEKYEEDGSRKSKKRRKKDNDVEEEESGMRKKKKKKKVGDDVTRDMGEDDGERSEVRGKKRKRNEEEDEGEEENKKRKKKKRRQSDNYSEAVEIKIERDREGDTTTENTTPSKKKKKEKKKKSIEAERNTEEMGEEEASIEVGRNIDEEEARETINPLIKIKMEKPSSDEAEERGKKKKKKKKQKLDEEKEEEEDEWIRKTVKNMKQEKIDENERRKESIDKGGKDTGKVAVRIKKERSQTDEEEAEEMVTNNAPTTTKKKKKQKMRIKEEKISSDEGRSLDNLPVPLFMIKREKVTPECRIKAKTKKEKG